MRSLCRIRVICAALLVILAIPAAGLVKASAQAGYKQVIVIAAPEDLDKIKVAFGAATLDSYYTLHLLNVPSAVTTTQIEQLPSRQGVFAVDNSTHRIVPKARRSGPSRNGLRVTTQNTSFYGTRAPLFYTEQPAALKIGVPEALKSATGAGIRVAVIDTGVDFNHPVLKNVLLPGKNYVGSTVVPSETDDPVLLTQSDAAAFEVMQSDAAAFEVMQSDASAFEVMQSDAAAFEVMQSDASAFEVMQQVLTTAPMFGHGTMSAGLVHLVAPQASIIPMKAFDASGVGTEWNIIRAVIDSVQMGANVINMSFASSKQSKLLDALASHLASDGIILVAAAGNDNTEAPTYPASIEAVVGVTALDANDQKAFFANYGRYVDVSAPGVDLVTTFPGMFAVASGTSESAPLVSGLFALVKQRGGGQDARRIVERAVDSLSTTSQLKNKLGSGRINAAKAVR